MQKAGEPRDLGPKFHPFPRLPTELRLKVISHALPAPTTLKLTANILIADPSFGLYLVFMITPPKQEDPQLHNNYSSSFFGRQRTVSPKAWYVEERKLNLLLVSREFNNSYLETFRFSLPTGRSGPWQMGGRIRYSQKDAIVLRNFAPLAGKSMVRQAFARNWPLQEFWTDVEELHVRIEIASPEFVDGCVGMIEKMRGLKRVKVFLWRGFGEDQGDSVKMQLLNAMKDRVKTVERMLREVMERNGEKDRLSPHFELVE